MRNHRTLGCLLVLVAAGCSLSPYFDKAPECAGGESRERELSCGPCFAGTATDICDERRQWVEVSCADPTDVDGDMFPNYECVAGEPIDCNDNEALAFPGATGVEECIVGQTQPCTTSCGTPSVQPCGPACTWGACIECVPGEATDCTTTCGSTGRAICTPDCVPPTDCPPPPDTCNGTDDDCDGATDEGFDCIAGMAEQPCLTACGSTGRGVCTTTCGYPPSDQCTVPPETCNGRDDDCDTECDEGSGECCAFLDRDCVLPGGGRGRQVCNAECVWGACSSTTEICNHLDDDGDGRPDNGFECVQGQPTSCTTTCGSSGTGTCSEDCRFPLAGSCAPPSEACNGIDDDCVEGPDNGLECVRGATQTQSCGNCSLGTQSRTCDSTCAWGDWTPCAGGGTCHAGDTESCTHDCGGSGNSTCSGACSWGPCSRTEICNDCDDDRDGRIDQGIWCTGTTSTSSGTTVALLDVFALNATTVYAVGVYSAGFSNVLRFDGTRWVPEAMPVAATLNSVWASASDRPIAVGNGGRVFERWTSSWVAGTTGVGFSLDAVWGKPGSDAWAGGTGGTRIVYLTRSSATWSALNTGHTSTIRGIWALPTGPTWWVVGDNGLILHWNGSAFVSFSIATTNGFYAVDGVNDTNGLRMVGVGGMAYWGGTSGFGPMPATGTTSILRGIDVVGSSDPAAWVVGDVGIILYFNSATGGWDRHSSGTTSQLNSVSDDGTANTWAVGNGGIILRRRY